MWCLLYLLTSTWLCFVRGNTDPCTGSVTTLSQSWRNSNPSPGADPGTDHCDKLTEGWYHFQLDGEDAALPTNCLQENVCGTVIPLRVELKADEDLTALPEGNETEASICGSYNVLNTLDCCVQRQPVRIRRCNKTRLIYRLPAYSVCPMAFCAHKVSELVPPQILARHGDRPRSLGPEPSTTADPNPPTSSEDETTTSTTDQNSPINRPLMQLLDSSSTSTAAAPTSKKASPLPPPPSLASSSATAAPDLSTSPMPESSAGATDSVSLPPVPDFFSSPPPDSSPPPSAALSSSPIPSAESSRSHSLPSSVAVPSSFPSVSSSSSSSSSPPSGLLLSVPSSTSPPVSPASSGLPSPTPSLTDDNSTSDASPGDYSSTAETQATKVATHLATLQASAADHASGEVSSDPGPTTAATTTTTTWTAPASRPATSSAADHNASSGATPSEGGPRASTAASSGETSPPAEKAAATTALPSGASSMMAAATTGTSSRWTTLHPDPGEEGPKSDQAVCFVVRGEYKASVLQWLKDKISSAPLTSRPDVISDFHLTVQEPIRQHQLTCVEMNITNPQTNATFPASHVVSVLENSSFAEDFQSAHASLSLEMHELSCQNQCYEAKADSLSLYETNKPLFVALISIALLAMVALVLLALFVRWRKQATWIVSEDQEHEDCEKGADHCLAVESPMTDSQIQQGEEKPPPLPAAAAAVVATPLAPNGHGPSTPAYDIPLADDDDGWVVPLEQAPPPATPSLADPTTSPPVSLQDLAQKTEDTKL